MTRRKYNGGLDRVTGLPRKARAKTKPEQKDVNTMAQDDERLKNPSDPASGRSTAQRTANTGSLPTGKVLATGKQQFLVSPRRLGAIGTMAVQPLAFSFIEQTLRNTPDVEVVDTIAPRGLVGALADGMPGPSTVLVARMTPQNAESLSH